MDDRKHELRNQRDKLIDQWRELEDRLIAQNRERQDRLVALQEDIVDAYKDYHRAERDKDFLGMSKAQERINELRKQLKAMETKPEE